MEIIRLDKFEDFESWVTNLKESQARACTDGVKRFSDLLFRGHADESWNLKTTLERFAPNVTSLSQYLFAADNIRLQVELHAETTWEPITEGGKIKSTEMSKIGIRADIPSIEYLVYLRHHGFPSPLLDWTRSPYIASLFAFSDCTGEGNIAIFVYQEVTEGIKMLSSQAPFIQNMGPHIKTHRRHTLQQAQYTLCLKSTGLSPHLPYDIKSHESVDSLNKQDTIYKIIIPKSEKLKVLTKLEQFNLNLYSVLGSEEALMSTLATREFLLSHRINH